MEASPETPSTRMRAAHQGQAALCPIALKDANAFIQRLHRHHKPVVGHKFSIGLANGTLRGVVIVGRPVSRHQDNGKTLEVTRCCTDGTRNACSKLYRAAWRVCMNLGYSRLITYTLPMEGGASLRGAGFKLIGERKGGNWNVQSRPREDTPEHLQGGKLLWQLALDVLLIPNEKHEANAGSVPAQAESPNDSISVKEEGEQ